MFPADSVVLVTGADGFIGSHLVEHLAASGVRVRALVLYNSFNSWGWLDGLTPEALRGVEVVPGDVRDFRSVREAMRGATHVLHLAAVIAIPYSYRAPQLYVDTNVAGTLNVLEAARELGVTRVVLTSTSEVYGTARQVPITEDHPLNAQSPYAATKIAADQLGLSYHASFNVPVVIARPFNTYGPRQSARAVIPTIISQVASGKRSIKMGATRPTRDFNFVKDTVAGLTALALAPGVEGQVLNIASNFEVSMGETARLIGEVMGCTLDIQTDQERLRPAASEVERLWGDNARILGRTAWRPAYGGLDGFKRGLKETAAWFTKPENLARYKTEIYNQ